MYIYAYIYIYDEYKYLMPMYQATICVKFSVRQHNMDLSLNQFQKVIKEFSTW